jgi:hypothetical protein
MILRKSTVSHYSAMISRKRENEETGELADLADLEDPAGRPSSISLARNSLYQKLFRTGLGQFHFQKARTKLKSAKVKK